MPESADIARYSPSGPTLESLCCAVAGVLNSKDICRALVDAVTELVPSEGAWVSAIHSGQGEVSRVHATGKGEKSARGPARPYTGSIEQMVAANGKPLKADLEVISQFALTDRHIAALKRTGAKSLALAPVRLPDGLFGVIGVNSSQADAFSPSHIELLEAAVARVEPALGAAETHERLARQIESSQIISTIIRSANSANSIEELVAAVATELRGAAPLDRLDLCLARDGDINEISVYEWGVTAGDWRSRLVSTGGDGLLAHITGSRKPWSSKDISGPEILNRFPALEAAARDGLRSIAAAPMVLNGRAAGALICYSSLENAYFAEHAAIIESVADHVSGAAVIHMVRERTEREAQELAVIAEISRALSSSLDPGQAFLDFVSLVRSLIPFDRVVVSLYDARQDLLTDTYVAGANLPSFGQGTTARASETMAALYIRDRKTAVLDEETLRASSGRYKSHREGLEAGLRSMMVVPLVWQNEVVGTLNFRSRIASAYGSREQATAERVAAQIAGTIATARLYKQLEHEAEVRKSLAAISLAASKDLDLVNVFERAADEISKIIEYDRVAISLIDQSSGSLRLRYFRGLELPERPLGGEIQMDPRIKRWRLMFQRTAEEGAYYGTEAQLRSRDKASVIWRPAMGDEIQSRLEVPIGAEAGGTIGYFGISSKAPGKYSLDDLGTLERIAVQITPAIQNAITHQQAVDLGQERSRSASLQAQAEELERLNQVKSQFLSNVTHELKTPLTSIMAFTDILSRNKAGNLNDKQVNQVEAVRRNAAQLQSLINDLVDVSRIESGRISLIEREFDLAELLREIGSNMRPHFDAKRQTLTFDLPEEPVIAIADRDRIAQVIMNLLSNASKFSEPGAQVTVTASCDSTWCTFSVTDNGIGISEHDQTHLFAAFYRADNSVTREHGGVGLGLSIVKSIVDLHGGKITLRSEQGKGSTFTVGIPRRLELRNAS